MQKNRIANPWNVRFNQAPYNGIIHVSNAYCTFFDPIYGY